MSRKTRFVCVSDTHNASPANGAFKLPDGDVLIHAGDLTNQGTQAEIRKTLDWIEAADFEAKIVIAGNFCSEWVRALANRNIRQSRHNSGRGFLRRVWPLLP